MSSENMQNASTVQVEHLCIPIKIQLTQPFFKFFFACCSISIESDCIRTVEDVVAALSVFIFGSVSLIVAIVVGVLTLTSNKLYTQMKILTIALNIADCSSLFEWAAYVAPMTYLLVLFIYFSKTQFFRQTDDRDSSTVFGLLQQCFWFQSLNVLLVISINRWVSLRFPNKYRNVRMKIALIFQF